MSELPFVDEHSDPDPGTRADHVVERAAPVRRLVSAVPAARSPLTRLLGTEPRAGFEVEQRGSGRTAAAMAGRHRFSRYRLVFELVDVADDETQLSARTYAEFPGWRGRAYRALVIGTGLHVVATNQILRSIRRAALG